MKTRHLWAIVAAFGLATPASAEVVSADSDGFTVRSTRVVQVPPLRMFTLFTRVSEWWSDSHTWSGDADALSISPLRAGACWCELLPDYGSVEHGHAIAWEPSRGRILWRAELGPLQALAATGKLEWRAVAAEGGGTSFSFQYDVAGRGLGDSAALAAGVDAVLAQQLDRLVAYAAANPAD